MWHHWLNRIYPDFFFQSGKKGQKLEVILASTAEEIMISRGERITFFIRVARMAIKLLVTEIFAVALGPVLTSHPLLLAGTSYCCCWCCCCCCCCCCFLFPLLLHWGFLLHWRVHKTAYYTQSRTTLYSNSFGFLGSFVGLFVTKVWTSVLEIVGVFNRFCPKFANSADSDQRAPLGALWSGSELFKNIIWYLHSGLPGWKSQWITCSGWISPNDIHVVQWILWKPDIIRIKER